MRFDFVRVMPPGPPLEGVLLVHWQAWPLDDDAVDVDLWPLGPRSLCHRARMVLAYRDARQCETCAISACLISNAAEVFGRYRARQMAERYERSTA